MLRPGRGIALLLSAVAVSAAAPALGEGSGDEGRAFVVPPVPPARYGVQQPTAAEQLTVTAADGTRLFVEVWLPAAKDGAVPPARVPVVAVATPYAFRGVPRPDRLNAVARWTELLVSRGYALANVHLRGTGESDGCWGVHDAVDADDVSRAVEVLARARFSTGKVALMGKSHDGGAALNTAARGARTRLAGLKAIIAVSPVLSYTDFAVQDGVPLPVDAASLVAIDAESSYAGRSFVTASSSSYEEGVTGARRDPAALTARAPCRAAEAAGLLATDGGVTPWMAERELALLTGQVRVPTLFTMGLHEIQTRQAVGGFDGLRARKAGIFGMWDHDYPDQGRLDPGLSRLDWEAMVLAWLDRWLRGARNGVDGWPVAQVQDTDGQWRAEPGFPRTGGPAGRLALGPAGTLGATRPTGATSFRALPPSSLDDGVLFETPPLARPLEVVGQPVADLWVTVDRPAAHLAARLEALDADGAVVRGSDRSGARSVRFLAPLVRDRFVQTTPVDPPVGTPFLVPLRFPPTDLVVPAGGRLRVVLSGTDPRTGAPAASPTTVTVLHSCEHPSALRFLLPRPRADLLDVLDGEEPADLGRHGARAAGLRDGAGLASARVCGRPAGR